MAVAGRQACGKPSTPTPPELLHGQPAPVSEVGRADSRALTVVGQRATTAAASHSNPNALPSPSSPTGVCRGRSCGIRLTCPSPLPAYPGAHGRFGAGQHRAPHEAAQVVGSPAPLTRWVTSCLCLEFACFQLPVATVVISFAVFEQGIGSVLLRVFLFRRTTGRILKEYVLQSRDEPHAAGLSC